MIMRTVKGDLLKLFKDGRYDIIVHGCNCFNTMGAGIAKQIKQQFPKAFIEDCKTKKGDLNKLGTYTFSDNVVNAYTQYEYGRGKTNVDYNAIKKVFTKINEDFKGKKVGIPKIGAGLAGGDWDTIKKIINKVTPNIEIEVVQYEKG